MSFLGIGNLSSDAPGGRSGRSGHLIVLMSFALAIPRRVALLDGPHPLRQVRRCHLTRPLCYDFAANGSLSPNCVSQFWGALQPPYFPKLRISFPSILGRTPKIVWRSPTGERRRSGVMVTVPELVESVTTRLGEPRGDADLAPGR